MDRRMCLPYVITSGFSAVLWSLLLFAIPFFVVIAAIKIFFFYVLVLMFRYQGDNGDYLTNEGTEIPMKVQNVESV
jgi:hypothetical protein